MPRRFPNFGSDVVQKPPPVSSRPTLEEDYKNRGDFKALAVVGIDADISLLAKRLIDPEGDFKVLGIVGTGGAGKTTLATQLYCDTDVQTRFPHKAFVSISQKWERHDVLQRMFMEVKAGAVIPSTEKELVRQLQDFLKDKQCLIVLDDMWKIKAWNDIYPVLPDSNKGCRVIITTRNREVPLYADSKCIIHEPKLLTKDQKWELFAKVAMEGRPEIEKNDAFEKLGRQMLEKCQGLPLEVVALAGVLRTKQEWDQWDAVSKAYVKCILKGEGMPNYGTATDMLELSYLDLPTNLKPCFLYFAIFPEDWRFQANILTEMWIGEGFVTNETQKGQETREDATMGLLEELAQRCILQVIDRSVQGRIHEFRMHDLMREFCIEKAKEHQFVGATESRQPRRTSALHGEHYPQENDHLRTLLDIGVGVQLPSGGRENLEPIPNKFKLLRVLCIWKPENVALPNQIGSLIHLRYLSIIYNKIFVLPKSIKNLLNLLYLVFETLNAEDVVEVPDDLVAKMENLRGLVVPMSPKRDSLNRLGLSGPRNLQSLRSCAGKWMTTELQELSHTVHDLTIFDIQKKEEMVALYECPSISNGSLRRLKYVSFSWGTEEPLEFDLEKLMGCTALGDLELDCPLEINSKGTTIQFPPNLMRLNLSRSAIKEQDDLMQVLGELPMLKHLSLKLASYLGKQLSCTTSGFPQLQVLHLRELENLEEWRMEEGAMARLREIWIDNCPKLKRLPESIRSITLNELKITKMPEEFCRRIGYEGSTSGAEDSFIIQHIPSVIVSVGS